MTRGIVAAAVALCLASHALAWNALGHKVVAEIAWRQLDAPTRESIVDTLRRHPRFEADFVGKMDDKAINGDKATEGQWIFQHAATWPDLIRRNKDFDRPVWHYVDFPIFLEPSDRTAFANRLPVNISTEYPTRIDTKDYNVIQAIEYCKETLRGRASAEEKSLAICWLFHLVGDIHQPLHSTALFSVEHFPKGDRGGNDIPLARGKNMHAMWDILLGAQYYMSNVQKSVAELSDRQRFGEVWDNAAKETDPRKWAAESHELCKSMVYNNTIFDAVRSAPSGEKPAPVDLPEDYFKAAGEQARRRVIAAGLRLGATLKSLAPKPTRANAAR
jgi:hypothetical protein